MPIARNGAITGRARCRYRPPHWSPPPSLYWVASTSDDVDDDHGGQESRTPRAEVPSSQLAEAEHEDRRRRHETGHGGRATHDGDELEHRGQAHEHPPAPIGRVATEPVGRHDDQQQTDRHAGQRDRVVEGGLVRLEDAGGEGREPPLQPRHGVLDAEQLGSVALDGAGPGRVPDVPHAGTDHGGGPSRERGESPIADGDHGQGDGDRQREQDPLVPEQHEPRAQHPIAATRSVTRRATPRSTSPSTPASPSATTAARPANPAPTAWPMTT